MKFENLYSKFCVGPTYGNLIYNLMKSNLFKSVLEIGCLNGYSTQYFIQAMKDGGNFEFSICDIHIQNSVRQLVENQKVNMYEKPSGQVINKNFDFIFVDGDHSISTVGEEIYLLLKSQTKTILAHDTFIGHPDFRGSVMLHDVFSNHKDYKSLSCNKFTPCDQTHYGISFFTKDEQAHEFAKVLFERINKKKEKIIL